MQRRDRSSNFELMRIFAMFLIITYHYALFSNFRFPAAEITFNRVESTCSSWYRDISW